MGLRLTYYVKANHTFIIPSWITILPFTPAKEDEDPYLLVLGIKKMPDLDLEYFRSVPWCAKLLAEPNVVVVATPSRQKKETTRDELFAVTLKTERTIRSWLTFYKRPIPGATSLDQLYSLVSVGPGISGHADLVAGGIIGSILDECMGNLDLVNRRLGFVDGEGFMVTANLNVKYLKAVPTPGDYLVTATLREVKGRKYYIGGLIKNGEGTLLATAESMWIDVLAKL